MTRRLLNYDQTSWHDFTRALTSTRKQVELFPCSSKNGTMLVEIKARTGQREKEAVKIADCRRKRKRLGWMREHAHHVKALGPFVLILSNADFLWVAEVAKSASACVYVRVRMYVYTIFVCVFRLFFHS